MTLYKDNPFHNSILTLGPVFPVELHFISLLVPSGHISPPFGLTTVMPVTAIPFDFSVFSIASTDPVVNDKTIANNNIPTIFIFSPLFYSDQVSKSATWSLEKIKFTFLE
jgi:hypothetical protein